jgi:ribosome-associated protein
LKKTVRLNADFIKLDSLLKLAGVTDTGGEAKHLVHEGRVRLNGEVVLERGRKIRDGDIVQVTAEASESAAKPEHVVRVTAAKPPKA